MNDIMPRQNDLAELTGIARLLAASGYFDAKGSSEMAIAQVATKIMAGREMGLGPFAAVQGIHVIQGRPALSANLIAAAIKASPKYDYRVVELTAETCEIEIFERVGGKLESLGKSKFTGFNPSYGLHALRANQRGACISKLGCFNPSYGLHALRAV